ncbi:PadR family transcriptional regulator [Maricaulis sp.]|uniref:PadR family transcriptional regulator n=1 Tax=Maricaulis sp. TaxID=1486257 RepID=UPI003A8F2A6F
MTELPRLSRTERDVLELLRTGTEMYGLQMVKASKILQRGSVYVYLNRMGEKGYVTSRQEKEPTDPGMPRRLYQITGLGRRVLMAVESSENILNGWLGSEGTA